MGAWKGPRLRQQLAEHCCEVQSRVADDGALGHEHLDLEDTCWCGFGLTSTSMEEIDGENGWSKFQNGRRTMVLGAGVMFLLSGGSSDGRSITRASLPDP